MKNKNGFALVTALAAIIIAVVLFLGLTTMGRGVRGQLKHFSSRTINFSIAENVCAKIIGQVYSSNWENRPFKSGPLTDSGNQMGGNYELYVEDFDTDEKLFDVYVKVESNNINLLHFWRIQYNDDLLDVSMYLPYIYENFPVKNFPGSGGTGVKTEVEKILKQRKENEGLSTQISSEISKAEKLNDILEILNLPPSNEDYNSDEVKNPAISAEEYDSLVSQPDSGGSNGSEPGQEQSSEETTVELMVAAYLKYLHRGPDVAGLNFWIKILPNMQSVEEMKEYHENSLEYKARQIAIEHFNLDPAVDNRKIVYYQLSIAVEFKDMDYNSPEFVQALKNSFNSLPPMPESFEEKNLYLGFDWLN